MTRKLICAYCKEPYHQGYIDSTGGCSTETWQQWQCLECRNWNDWPRRPAVQRLAMGDQVARDRALGFKLRSILITAASSTTTAPRR